MGLKPSYIITIGRLFYGSENQLVTDAGEAFVFTERSDALEIVSWLEYHRIEDASIVEVNVPEDTYKEISDLFGEQKRKGESKYGGTVDEKDNDDPVYWINHAREEVADLLVYLTKLKQKLEKIDK